MKGFRALCPLLQAVLLHPPNELIKPVLAEERLALKDHERHAPMTCRLLRGLIFGDDVIKMGFIRSHFGLQIVQIQSGAGCGVFQMIALVPILHAAKDNAAHLVNESEAFSLFGSGAAQAC